MSRRSSGKSLSMSGSVLLDASILIIGSIADKGFQNGADLFEVYTKMTLSFSKRD